MVKVDRRSDSDSDVEDGVRKKKEGPSLRQLREDYPQYGCPWNWDKVKCALFWIIIFGAGAAIIATSSKDCPRAGTITQCATKYEMIDGVEFTSEVNCTTVKEKRNCKPGKKDKTDSTDPRDHQRVRF